MQRSESAGSGWATVQSQCEFCGLGEGAEMPSVVSVVVNVAGRKDCPLLPKVGVHTPLVELSFQHAVGLGGQLQKNLH